MSAHRRVKVPPPVSPFGVEISFEFFVRFLVDNEDRFNRTAAGARAGMRLLTAFEGSPAGTEHRLHPDDWKLLHEAAEKPSCGYPVLTQVTGGETLRRPIPTRELLTLISALSPESTEEKPDEPG